MTFQITQESGVPQYTVYIFEFGSPSLHMPHVLYFVVCFTTLALSQTRWRRTGVELERICSDDVMA